VKPRLEFSIGADKQTHLFFRVKVWRRYSELQVARDKVRDKGEVPQPCDGFCHTFHERHCNDRCLGEIHFCADRLTIATIAHEALHAAVGLAQWIRPADKDASNDSRDLVVVIPDVNECLAYATGYMTEGIIWNLRREKFKVKLL
jgi:hypothetical protein